MWTNPNRGASETDNDPLLAFQPESKASLAPNAIDTSITVAARGQPASLDLSGRTQTMRDRRIARAPRRREERPRYPPAVAPSVALASCSFGLGILLSVLLLRTEWFTDLMARRPAEPPVLASTMLTALRTNDLPSSIVGSITFQPDGAYRTLRFNEAGTGLRLPAGTGQALEGANTLTPAAYPPPQKFGAPHALPGRTDPEMRSLAPASSDFVKPAVPAPSARVPVTIPPAAGRVTPSVTLPRFGGENLNGASEKDAVRQVLDRYGDAYRLMDVKSAAEIWPSFDRRTFARDLATMTSHELDFERCDISVDSSMAVAYCRGSVQFTRKGNQTTHTERRQWLFKLRRNETAWKIDTVVVSDLTVP